MKRRLLSNKLPSDWFTEISINDVDPAKPGIYEWRIDELKVYIGQYEDPSRPRNEYRRNIENLLAGKPYRKNKPGFRKVHEALAEAWKIGQKITLTILENQPVKVDRNRRERELIADRHCIGLTILNSRAGRSSVVSH